MSVKTVVCVCVCVRERERETEREGGRRLWPLAHSALSVHYFVQPVLLPAPPKYEAYVKSKFRYKIYLVMNDVTSMLYVSLVRQFETLLFYLVTSRIEALVSRHKFLNACVEKVYRLLFWNPSGTDFPKMQIFSHNPVHSFPWHIWEKKIRPDPWWWIFCFRGFSPQSALRDRESRRWGDRCVCRRCTLSRPLLNCLDHRRTILSLIAPSPQTSHTCLWISAGWIFLACRNLMTARISQSAGVSMRSAILQQL